VSPTPVDLFAAAVENLAYTRTIGTYHAACQGQATYADIIAMVADHLDMPRPVVEYIPDNPINLSLTSTTKLGRWRDVFLARLGDLTEGD